jgi:hypothetical protein
MSGPSTVMQALKQSAARALPKKMRADARQRYLFGHGSPRRVAHSSLVLA